MTLSSFDLENLHEVHGNGTYFTDFLVSACQGQKESLCAFAWEKFFMFHSVLCGCCLVGRFCGNVRFSCLFGLLQV